MTYSTLCRQGHPDDVLDDYYAEIDFQREIDAGRCCPRCNQRIQALRVQALGCELWACPHCKAEWLNAVKEMATVQTERALASAKGML